MMSLKSIPGIYFIYFLVSRPGGAKVITHWAPSMGFSHTVFAVSQKILIFQKKLFNVEVFSINFVIKKVILNFDVR